MFNINKFFFKYLIYCPAVLLRREWIFGYLKRLQNTQTTPRVDIDEIQLEKLNKLISHARKTVPYYKALPDKPLKSIDELQNVPFLDKEYLRKCPDDLCSTIKGLKPRFKTTGGSTGAAVTLRKDAEGMAQELAATWRGYAWAGIDIGDKQARFWGIPHSRKEQLRAKLVDFVTNRKRLSAFSFSEKEFSFYIEELEKFKPKYFYGYVSMIRQFAEYIKKEKVEHKIRPVAIITTAEVLTELDRTVIEEVFHCKVFNEYGCGEIGTIAHECKHGSLHLNSENVIVEAVDSDSLPVGYGVTGELVVTDLVNYSMPLIRYRIKDFGVLSSEVCSCGLSLPVLKGVYGREYDYLINSRGDKYHGEFFLYLVEDLAKDNINIDGVQFIQSQNLSITIKLVVANQEFDFFPISIVA